MKTVSGAHRNHKIDGQVCRIVYVCDGVRMYTVHSRGSALIPTLSGSETTLKKCSGSTPRNSF